MRWLILLFSLCKASIKVGLITSTLTDGGIVAELSANLKGVMAEVERTLRMNERIEMFWEEADLVSNPEIDSWHLPKSFIEESIQVILDAASSVIYSSFLSEYSFNQNLLHIVISREMNSIKGEHPTQNTIYAEDSYTTLVSAFSSLFKQFNWQKAAIIQDDDYRNIQLANALISSKAFVIEDLILTDLDDVMIPDKMSYRLRTVTKRSGIKIVIVLARAQIAAQVLRAASDCDMDGTGYGWIFNQDAMDNIIEILKMQNSLNTSGAFTALRTGILGFFPSDYASRQTNSLLTYQKVLALICQGFLQLAQPTGKQLHDYIISSPKISISTNVIRFNDQGIKISEYSLYNIVNFVEYIVAEYKDSQLYMLNASNIIWPGLTSSIPDDRYTLLSLGLLYPAHDNLNNKLQISNEILQGFDLAVTEINSSPDYTNYFKIQPIYIDTFMNPSIAANNLKTQAPHNTIGYIGPHSLELCNAYISAQSSQSIPKPLMTYWASSSSLSNPVTYPNLLQIIQADGFQAVALVLYIQRQGWSRIGVIYSNDDLGQGMYGSFTSNIGSLDIIIENQENLRRIEYSLEGEKISSDTKDSINEVLSEIVRNQIKIIVFLGNSNLTSEIAIAAYNKLLFGEEYVWVGAMWIDNEVFSRIDTEYPDQKAEIFSVLEGAVALRYSNASKELKGQNFTKNYKLKYNQDYTTISMLTYDSVYTYASTLKDMIINDIDYTNNELLTFTLRSADLKGASGKIKFSDGSNSRSAIGYTILSIISGKLIPILEYNPQESPLFTPLYTQASPPDDSWPIHYDCPFASHMSSTSPRGIGIIIAIGIILLIFTLILSFFSYKHWKGFTIEQINTKTTKSWKDTFVQLQIAVEFFQFIAIAPDFQSLKIVVQVASNIFMLDVIKVAASSKSDYWILLSVVCVFCYTWFFLVLVLALKGEKSLEKSSVVNRIIAIINSLFLPFYGNTLFLPVMAILLDALVCDHQAQGSEYVWRDCYTQCWKGKHIVFAIMSLIAIILYEPIAAFLRPIWQESRTSLNIKIKPYFLLIKTCLQIVLIAIGKSLQSISPLAHSILFTILIFTFAVFVYIVKPFNYRQCNLWEFSSMIGVAYLSLLSILGLIGDASHYAWFIALCLGWAVIVFISIFVQRKYMPALLVTSGSRRKIYDAIKARESVEENNNTNIH